MRKLLSVIVIILVATFSGMTKADSTLLIEQLQQDGMLTPEPNILFKDAGDKPGSVAPAPPLLMRPEPVTQAKSTAVVKKRAVQQSELSQLKRKLHTSQSELHALRKQNEALKNRQPDVATEQSEAFRDENKQLHQQLMASEKQLTENARRYEKQVGILTARSEELQTQMTRLQLAANEAASQKALLEQQLAKQSGSDKALATQRGEAESLRTQLAAANEKTTALNENIATLEKTARENSARAAALEQSLKEAASQKALLEQQLAKQSDSDKALATQRAEAESLRTQLTAANEKTAALSENIATLEKTARENSVRTAALEQSLKEAASQKALLEQQLAKQSGSDKALATQRAEAESLRTQLATANEKTTALNENIATLEKTARENSARAATLEQSLKEAASQKALLEQQLAKQSDSDKTLATQLEQASKQNSEQLAQLNSAKDKIAQQFARLASLEQQAQKAEEEKKQALASLSTLQKEHDATTLELVKAKQSAYSLKTHKSEEAKINYAYGAYYAVKVPYEFKVLENAGHKFLPLAFQQGFKDKLANTMQLSEEEVGRTLTRFDQQVGEMQVRERDRNKKQSIQFVEQAAKVKGAEQAQNGVVYLVVNKGKTPLLTVNDTIRFRLDEKISTGKKISGGEIRVGMVSKFPDLLQQGVLRVGSGGKVRITVPSELAYGEQGIPGTVPPGVASEITLDILGIVK
ncbi:FKBP-type peptidyl-prolyl cis-trans isomerase [Phytobacter palmae]|nr:FKBP-type peptidyl-prolyl cis-trans isomerase [Phytobacter palmae]